MIQDPGEPACNSTILQWPLTGPNFMKFFQPSFSDVRNKHFEILF
jgi:hypothetical protein